MVRLLRTASVVVVLSIAVVGCGGSGNDSPDRVRAESITTDAHAQVTTKRKPSKGATTAKKGCLWSPDAPPPDFEGVISAFTQDPDANANQLRDLADEIVRSASPSLRKDATATASSLRALASNPWDIEAMDAAIAKLDALSSRLGDRC